MRELSFHLDDGMPYDSRMNQKTREKSRDLLNLQVLLRPRLSRRMQNRQTHLTVRGRCSSRVQHMVLYHSHAKPEI